MLFYYNLQTFYWSILILNSPNCIVKERKKENLKIPESGSIDSYNKGLSVRYITIKHY